MQYHISPVGVICIISTTGLEVAEKRIQGSVFASYVGDNIGHIMLTKACIKWDRGGKK